MVVDGEVGWDQGVEEFEARGFLVYGWGYTRRGFVPGWVLKVPIWFIFNDYDIVLNAEGVYLLASLDA